MLRPGGRLEDRLSGWPGHDRRDPARPDRRTHPRGGRRETDLPSPILCARCGDTEHVRGLGRTQTSVWCRCLTCGNVWRHDWIGRAGSDTADRAPELADGTDRDPRD